MDRYSFRLKFNKFWDVVYPFVFFMLLLVVVTLVVLIIGAAIYGGASSSYIIERFPFIPLTINVLFYGITIIVQRKTLKKDSLRFGEHVNKWKAWQILLAALVAAIISYALNLLISISPLPDIFPGYYDSAQVAFYGQSKILLILATVVLGPAAEEIIFRGLIYERMKHYLSIPLSVIISAAMFGLYHANVIQFIFATIIGIILALYYEKSGSLIAPIAAHMVMNAMALPSYF